MGQASFGPALNAYRLYGDGSESGSAALAAQDTPYDADVSSGNVKVHVRVRVDETGGANGGNTDTWQLQVKKNTGSWVNVTASSSDFKTDTASGLTDDGATTDRSTDPISNPGSGAFHAGVQEEGDGVLTHKLVKNDFTEHVYAGEVVSADVADSDQLTFRVSLNGGIPGLLHNVTPTIDITKGSGTQTVVPDGVASVAAVGSPTVIPGAVTIVPDGVAEIGAVGLAVVVMVIAATAIASVGAVGQPAVAPGPVTIVPDGVASVGAVGSPDLAYRVKPRGVTSSFELLVCDADINLGTSGYSASGPQLFPHIDEGVAEHDGDSTWIQSWDVSGDHYVHMALPTLVGEIDPDGKFVIYLKARATSGVSAVSRVGIWEDGVLIVEEGIGTSIISQQYQTYRVQLNSGAVADKTKLELRQLTTVGGELLRITAIDVLVPILPVGDPAISQEVQPDGVAAANGVGQPAITPGPVTIVPDGVAAASAVGLPAVSLDAQVIAPDGIASTAALGTPSLAYEVQPDGVASVGAVGAPSLAYEVQPDGIAATNALGLPIIAPVISPTGVAEINALGTPAISQEVQPTGVAEANALGSPSLTYLVVPAGIASAEAFGSPAVSQEIVATGIAEINAVGLPHVSPQLIVPTGVASASVVGLPVVSQAVSTQTILPDGIAADNALGLPSISPQLIEPAGIAHANAIGLADVVGPIVPTGVAETNAIGLADVLNVTGDQPIAPTGVPHANAVGLHTVDSSVGTVTIFPESELNGQAFGLPTVVYVVRPISVPDPAFDAFESEVGEPSVYTRIAATGIASAAVVGKPRIANGVLPTGIASVAAVGSHTVATGPVSIVPSGLKSEPNIGLPVVALQTISPTGVGSIGTLGLPSLTLNVVVTGLADADAFGLPTVGVPGQPTIAVQGVASAAVVGLPVISPVMAVAGHLNASAVGLPSIATGPVAILPTGVASSAAVGLPLVSHRQTIGATWPIIVFDTVGEPAVLLLGHVVSTGVASAEAIGFPAIVLRPAVVPTGIVSVSSTGSPSISTGNIVPTGIESVAVVGESRVTPGSLNPIPDGIAHANALGLPTVLLTGFNRSIGVDRTTPIDPDEARSTGLREDCTRTTDIEPETIR